MEAASSSSERLDDDEEATGSLMRVVELEIDNYFRDYRFYNFALAQNTIQILFPEHAIRKIEGFDVFEIT